MKENKTEIKKERNAYWLTWVLPLGAMVSFVYMVACAALPE